MKMKEACGACKKPFVLLKPKWTAAARDLGQVLRAVESLCIEELGRNPGVEMEFEGGGGAAEA